MDLIAKEEVIVHPYTTTFVEIDNVNAKVPVENHGDISFKTLRNSLLGKVLPDVCLLDQYYN